MVDAPHELWHSAIVFLDEAETFTPEGGEGAAADSTHAVLRLARKGRKRGYGLVAATQRMTMVKKTLVAMCATKLISRTGTAADAKRAADELGLDTEQRRKLGRLEPGEFLAYGPAISPEPILVRSTPALTRHPEMGKAAPPAAPAPEAVRVLPE